MAKNVRGARTRSQRRPNAAKREVDGQNAPSGCGALFCVVAGSRAAALSCSFRARIGAPALCCRVGRCRLGKNAPFGTSKRKRGDNIEEFGILFDQHARFDTRLMARTEVWYPRSTHTAFVTWAFFGRWGPNRRSWQKTGYQIAQFADLGAKKALGGTKPRDSARGSHLKGAKPRDSVCGVASRGGQTCDLDVRPRPEASVREM